MVRTLKSVPASHSSNQFILGKPGFNPFQPVGVGFGVVIREHDDVASRLFDSPVQCRDDPGLLDQGYFELREHRAKLFKGGNCVHIKSLGHATNFVRWADLGHQRPQATGQIDGTSVGRNDD